MTNPSELELSNNTYSPSLFLRRDAAAPTHTLRFPNLEKRLFKTVQDGQDQDGPRGGDARRRDDPRHLGAHQGEAPRPPPRAGAAHLRPGGGEEGRDGRQGELDFPHVFLIKSVNRLADVATAVAAVVAGGAVVGQSVVVGGTVVVGQGVVVGGTIVVGQGVVVGGTIVVGRGVVVVGTVVFGGAFVVVELLLLLLSTLFFNTCDSPHFRQFRRKPFNCGPETFEKYQCCCCCWF